jgi:CubicO group peptidase (beta-lactamase class C family)
MIVSGKVPGEVADMIERRYREGAPGVAVSVVRDGAIEFALGAGTADLGRGVPIGPDTAFDVASMTKQFTAACVAALVSEGALSPEDEARRYLPELAPYASGIRIKHLVSHTSGLRDYLGLMTLSGLDLTAARDKAEVFGLAFAQRRARFAPGARFAYSNTNYLLLAEIVARASKAPLSEYARTRLFEPLGMAATRYNDDHRAPQEALARAYARGEGGAYTISESKLDVVGDGNLIITALDAAKWNAAFFKDAPSAPDARFFASLERPAFVPAGYRGAETYCWGVSRSAWRGVETVEHGGAWMGWRSTCLRIPSLKFAVTCLWNSDDAPFTLAKEIALKLIGSRLPEPEPEEACAGPEIMAPCEEEIGRWVGDYDSNDGLSASIRYDGHALSLTMPWGEFPLSSAGASRCAVMQIPIEVVLSLADGGIEQRIGDEEPSFFARRRPHSPSDSDIDGVIGSYYSSELRSTWKIHREGEGLRVARREGREETLTAIAPGSWVGRILRIDFSTGGRTASVSAPGIEGIEFEKTDR